MKFRVSKEHGDRFEVAILLHSLRSLFFVVFIASAHFAFGADETEAFALLVQTLNATESNPPICCSLMRGMLSGLEGRRNVTPPPGWSELRKKLGQHEDSTVRELSMKLAQIFGDPEATRRYLSVLRDRSVDGSKRLLALRALLEQRCDQLPEIFGELLEEPTLVLDAIRGCAVVANPSAPAILLAKYEQFDPDLRRVVVETLATRKEYAESLFEAMQAKKVKRDEIPAHVARSLSEILGKRFIEFYGELRPVAADREQLIAKYKKLLTPEAIAKADASRGRAVFQKTCAACHLLYGVGGKVGPDLTGSNRANLDYILLNSVDPSYDVPDGYRTVQILTTDGQVINGVLAEEDAIRVVLKTADQPRVVIAKQDIETRKLSPKSMMPDGQLDQMKAQEVVDLIKYLRTTEQVEIAK